MAKENGKQDKRERIKAAALELFAQHGYHGTSTEMIITKAGVSKGLLFFYFKNKQELLKTIRNEWIENLWAAILPIKDEALKPIDCFEVLLDNIRQTLIEHESEYRLHYSLMLIGDPLSSRAELKQLSGYNRLHDYLHWLFRRLKVEDVKSEVALFSDLMLGAQMRFLTLKVGQRENFKVIKKALMKRYT